jgi:hypothetical protein
MYLLSKEINEKNIRLDESSDLDSKRRAIIHIRRVFKTVLDQTDSIVMDKSDTTNYMVIDPRVNYLESQLFYYCPSLSADFLEDEGLQHKNSRSDVLLIHEEKTGDKGRLTEMLINLLNTLTGNEEVILDDNSKESIENNECEPVIINQGFGSSFGS